MYTQEQDALLPVHHTLHQLISLYVSTPTTILICTQTTAEPSAWLWNKEALQYSSNSKRKKKSKKKSWVEGNLQGKEKVTAWDKSIL